MKIELEKVDAEIKILEYVIRDQSFMDDQERVPKMCFQARIEAPSLLEGDDFHASFSYYDKDDNFLGVDKGSTWAEEFLAYSPYPISFELDIPKDTCLIKCQLISKRRQKSIWDYGWQTFAVLVFGLLISAIINLWL
ncbi:hypothetical protein O5O45_10860 [Hahella aquimaris]|uniref:hypothetical protein n=1 Tax=Hahella sp. HNIBRBA332 TaxID=3015983 RepID=UPI00273CC93A|nr:hypothetical protein [Hahella sp. HNIBRBA332]WLQ16419.1 hypothetical protein O5O45_10860 [Hahella sp. HNIBRBA332]